MTKTNLTLTISVRDMTSALTVADAESGNYGAQAWADFEAKNTVKAVVVTEGDSGEEVKTVYYIPFDAINYVTVAEESETVTPPEDAFCNVEE